MELDAFERALNPKKFALLKGGGFASNVEQFSESNGAAIDWFSEHLFDERRLKVTAMAHQHLIYVKCKMRSGCYKDCGVLSRRSLCSRVP